MKEARKADRIAANEREIRRAVLCIEADEIMLSNAIYRMRKDGVTWRALGLLVGKASSHLFTKYTREWRLAGRSPV